MKTCCSFIVPSSDRRPWPSYHHSPQKRFHIQNTSRLLLLFQRSEMEKKTHAPSIYTRQTDTDTSEHKIHSHSLLSPQTLSMASPFGCVLVVIHNCVLCRITYISSCFLFTLPEHAHIRSRLRLNIPGDSSFHINKIVNINAFTNIYISMQYAYTRTSCVVSSAYNLFVLFTLNALPELLH